MERQSFTTYNPSNEDSSSKVSSTTLVLPSIEERRILDHTQNPLFSHQQYQSLSPSTRYANLVSDLAPALNSAMTASTPPIRYKECLKNHAASMGGHVVDGCGEFMPRGEEGSVEALKCAVCECHRNFHKKEIGVLGEEDQQQYTENASNPSYYYYKSLRGTVPLLPPHHRHNRPYYHTLTPTQTTMMNFGGSGVATLESSNEDLDNMLQPRGQDTSIQVRALMSSRRFRTKLSKEQKEKMMEFAEKLEWKMQKEEEEEVKRFCSQVGVSRKVFKVWMHNNKQAMKKKQV